GATRLRRCVDHLIETRIVQHRCLVTPEAGDVRKSLAPQYVSSSIVLSGGNGLRKSLFQSGQGYDDHNAGVPKRLGRLSGEGTIGQDLMNRGPAQGKERAALALQPEIVKSAQPFALGGKLDPRKGQMDLCFENAALAQIRHPKHQTGNTIAPRD